MASYFSSRPRSAESGLLEPTLLKVLEHDERIKRETNEEMCLCLFARNPSTCAGGAKTADEGRAFRVPYLDLLLNPAHARQLAAFLQARPRKRKTPAASAVTRPSGCSA